MTPDIDRPKPTLEPNRVLARLTERGLLRSFSVEGETRFDVKFDISEDQQIDVVSHLIEEVQWLHRQVFFSELNQWYGDHPDKDDRPKLVYE